MKNFKDRTDMSNLPGAKLISFYGSKLGPIS